MRPFLNQLVRMMLWISSGIEHWVTESVGLRGGRGSRLGLVEVAIGGLQNSHAAMRSSPRNKLGASNLGNGIRVANESIGFPTIAF